MDNIKKENSQYVIMDKSGMIIENSEEFNNNLCGYVTDIIQKNRNIMGTNTTTNSVEIFFENQLFLIKDNVNNNLNMSMIIDHKK